MFEVLFNAHEISFYAHFFPWFNAHYLLLTAWHTSLAIADGQIPEDFRTRGTRGGPHLRYVFRGEGVFFRTSACPRFCKRRVLFCTQKDSILERKFCIEHVIF